MANQPVGRALEQTLHSPSNHCSTSVTPKKKKKKPNLQTELMAQGRGSLRLCAVQCFNSLSLQRGALTLPPSRWLKAWFSPVSDSWKPPEGKWNRVPQSLISGRQVLLSPVLQDRVYASYWLSAWTCAALDLSKQLSDSPPPPFSRRFQL